jgi:glycerol transport system ATP-binding protein
MYEGEIVQIGTPAELFERPSHTFVGYFIGSPGMNVMPAEVAGNTVKIGSETINLGYAPKTNGAAKIELGIRPEFIRLGREGMPVSISKVEDIGRQKIVRARFADQPIAIVVREDVEIPADARVSFDPDAISIYAGSWRVGREG